MAEQTVITQPSLTEEAFVADRMKFWSSFTSFTTFVVGGLAVFLAFLAWWLV